MARAGPGALRPALTNVFISEQTPSVACEMLLQGKVRSLIFRPLHPTSR
jgi:hypothetical protein